MIDKNTLTEAMPLWGPYSKKYMGISKIVTESNVPGARFDLVVFPTVAFSGVRVPNVNFACGYHPWEVSPDLHYFEYRYDLVEKDKVYANVAFSQMDDTKNVVRVEFVNNTDLNQNCMLNLFSAMEYPYGKSVYPKLPTHSSYWKALDYVKYTYADPRPWDGLNPDGAKKGEFWDSAFTENRGLGDRVDRENCRHVPYKAFGTDAGDTVTYFKETSDFRNAVLAIRYRTTLDENAVFVIETKNRGIVKTNKVTFKSSEELTFAYVPVGMLRFGTFEVSMVSEGTGGVELDFFVLMDKTELKDLSVENRKLNRKPKVYNIGDGQISYKYHDVQEAFYLKNFSTHKNFREIHSGSLEDAVINRLSVAYYIVDDMQRQHNVQFQRKVSDEGYYHNVQLHSVFVEPHSSRVEYVVIGSDALDTVTLEDCQAVYEREHSKVKQVKYSPQGERFELSNQLLRAATLTNIVYPIYRHGEYIKHFTPGKRWDSLYTWDSGFIGLGLLEVNPKLSEYILDLYFSEMDNEDFAFLFHGAPVPTEIYQYLEILKRSNNKESLYHYYPRAKKFYDFLTGSKYGSTTSKFKTNLSTTYDYYYNCSGMDDLPGQLEILHRGLQKTVSPVIPSVQIIMSAKVMKIIAEKLGLNEDVKQYEEDIKRLSDALQTYSWDEECGYFSYVVHDEEGNYVEKFVDDKGENLNKGMEGIYPLFAGICTPEQAERLMGHLQSPEKIFSKYGISAVDMTSGYYTGNGYWNGCVWFPHQWFVWKAMLDMGYSDFAFKIAKTALESWKRETDFSYNTYEMINIATGRGGWHHQFGGLSTPINIWANAYYSPGIISTGFDVWIESSNFAEDCTECRVEYELKGNEKAIMIVSMKPGLEYKVLLNKQPVQYTRRTDCALEIPLEEKNGVLEIKVVD